MGSAMNQQSTYLPLIQSLLNSPRDEQTAILQNNLELIDDNFASVLREWATQTLAKIKSKEAYKVADNLYDFNVTISSFPQGSRANNIEIAIACLDVGLTIFTRETASKKWAMFQTILTIFTRETASKKWAMFQNSLGIKYNDRIRGDRGENIEKAIECYEAALQVLTHQALPQQWAMTQNNLGLAYKDRIRGDRGENIERAIECYQAALQVLTHQALPQQWATTQNNLAIAYSDRIRGDRGENIERAIECYQAALQVRTRQALPQQWAMTQENLAYAYQEQGLISEAIKYFKSSLEIFKPDALPLSCLKAARNLGNTAFDIEQWETAIFGYEKAIESVEQSREWVTSDNP
jgi:tetratricopeptide (TPR) repeat protein